LHLDPASNGINGLRGAEIRCKSPLSARSFRSAMAACASYITSQLHNSASTPNSGAVGRQRFMVSPGTGYKRSTPSGACGIKEIAFISSSSRKFSRRDCRVIARCVASPTAPLRRRRRASPPPASSGIVQRVEHDRVGERVGRHIAHVWWFSEFRLRDDPFRSRSNSCARSTAENAWRIALQEQQKARRQTLDRPSGSRNRA
jgi:hypothetical protein